MPAESDMFDERSLLQQTVPKAGGLGDGSEQRAVSKRVEHEGKDPNVRFYWFP